MRPKNKMLMMVLALDETVKESLSDKTIKQVACACQKKCSLEHKNMYRHCYQECMKEHGIVNCNLGLIEQDCNSE